MEELDPKDLKLTKLPIERETQDKVMETFGFENPSSMFEVGTLLLSTFADAKNQGCEKMYFYCTNNEGRGEYYEFDYLKLIEFIKLRPNDTCLHTIKINKY